MKNETILTPQSCTNECIKLIERLGHIHGRFEVFAHLIELLAISLSNQVDFIHFEKREARYFEIIEQYSKEELQIFPEMIASIATAVTLSDDSPRDILGPMFHEMELHNEWRGQYFTPQNVCDMMGVITAGTDLRASDKEYITICEPCVGSGAMIFGFAKALQKQGYSHTTGMVVSATDIDIRCVHMAYIQFSLYGIPAVVVHGNSLTLEEWSYWYTPAYIAGGWHRKLMETQEKTGGIEVCTT